AHRLGEVRELLAHAEGESDAMQLLDVGESRADEHAAVRQPIEEARFARLQIALDTLRERRIERGNAVEGEIAALLMQRRSRRELRGKYQHGQQAESGLGGRCGGHARAIETASSFCYGA